MRAIIVGGGIGGLANRIRVRRWRLLVGFVGTIGVAIAWWYGVGLWL